jgi:hypothetical protein
MLAVGRLVDLVAVLRTQHARGRGLTADVLRLAGTSPTRATGRRRRDTLRLFLRMYRPHEVCENTVLFPAFPRDRPAGEEYEALGARFEQREHQLFGARGLDRVVDEVAGLERALGIHDLARFTPP